MIIQCGWEPLVVSNVKCSRILGFLLMKPAGWEQIAIQTPMAPQRVEQGTRGKSQAKCFNHYTSPTYFTKKRKKHEAPFPLALRNIMRFFHLHT